MRKSAELATAYHEAGHAIVARIVTPRIRVKYVTIIPDPQENTLGHCLWGRYAKNFQPDVEVNGLTRTRIESRVMCSLAGDVAERKFTGKRPSGSQPDFHHALNLASYVASSEREITPYIQWLVARTEVLIDLPAHWQCVEALAKKLIRERKVSGKDVQTLLGARQVVN